MKLDISSSPIFSDRVCLRFFFLFCRAEIRKAGSFRFLNVCLVTDHNPLRLDASEYTIRGMEVNGKPLGDSVAELVEIEHKLMEAIPA